MFSQPVELRLPVDGAEGMVVDIMVQHAADPAFTHKGLTLDPTATCMPDGSVDTVWEKRPVIEDGFVTVYTCSASTFVTTFNGGPASINFADDNSVQKSFTIGTGDIPEGEHITSVVIDLAFQSIDGTNWLVP